MKNVHDKVQYNRRLGYRLHNENNVKQVHVVKFTVERFVWVNVLLAIRIRVHEQNPGLFGAIEVFVP